MRTAADKRHFWLRKIHSLTGFIPIGLYMLVHVFGENAAIRFFGGADKGFNTVADFFKGVPLYLLGGIEVVLVGSILFHAIYGLFIVADSRPNLTRYGRARNWNYFIQRVTGVIAFVFLGYHVYTTRFTVYMGMLSGTEVPVSAHWMANNIFGHGPFVTALYAIGVVSAVYHFFNGVWNGLISWGITVGPKAQRVSAAICTTVGVLASVISLWVLWGFQPFLQASGA